MAKQVDAGADARDFAAGFQRVEREVRAVPDAELMLVNMDVPSAVATVLGALPEVVALREQVAALPGFDLARFDRLRDYALALAHAHSAYRAALEPADPSGKFSEELIVIRNQLFTDALALAKRGQLEEERVGKLKSGLGYKNVAFDVYGLVQLFRQRWAEVSARTAVTVEELDRAAQLSQQLVTAVGLKEQSPAGLTAVTLLRQQAFTLLVTAYDDARRAVSFLRWHHGDSDDIAPSIWAGRAKRKSGEAATEPSEMGASSAPPEPQILTS